MITISGCGWCKLTIGDFAGSPSSWMTDVPIDTLRCFINYYRYGNGSVYFDCEGYSFTLVLSDHSVFIIECKDTAKLYDLSDVAEINDLANEAITDIEGNIDEWVKETLDDSSDDEDIRYYTESIAAKIEELKEILGIRKLVTEICEPYHSCQPHQS